MIGEEVQAIRLNESTLVPTSNLSIYAAPSSIKAIHEMLLTDQ